MTRDTQDPVSTQVRTPDSYPHSPGETLVTPNMACHEVKEGEDDDRRSRLNKKRSVDRTPSSFRKSKKEAKGVGAKTANQIDRLIEVVATRQLGDEESARSTPSLIA